MQCRLIALVPLAIAVSACATVSSTRPVNWIGVADVLANPAGFDGKVVTIKGWALIKNENYRIWATQSDYEKLNRKQCISLLNSYNDDARNESLDQTTVLITGTVYQDIFHNEEGKDVIRLGTCNKVGIRFIDPDGLRPFDK